ncbi:hypothetical protein D1841_11730 [Neglecta sp. X4]|uniref:flagellar filament capping protein FliD n=1 Tax=unclassified Neglectibacter TaxID=2632164 RepID=UPI001369DF3A|nr:MULTISPECIES: flagellar filament capping protein FliD [unclassified Neglectibacter]NBI17388.1 hypothetical protein [Neglectibacter sp. 59]NBJ73933.1 hypothetical protein [Neglectibacter sp. X4]NCE80508.1 hypothetical protein [Neglectibacter sp. X58]
MASISSLTGSSSTSSIYGNRNVISGLASGMDTEAMIENSIAGYKNKIYALQRQQIKTEWKQDAYRSIISKMVGLTQKYTSYTSGTNLFSNSFFNRAVITKANGKYADKVSATGKSSNDVQISSIKQLAQAAKYTKSADSLIEKASRAEMMDWSQPVKESTIAGSMNLVYGSNNLTIRFGEDDIFESQQDLVDNINKQLSEQTIKTSGGAGKASEYLEAKLNDDGRIVLQQKEGKDNKFYIDSASDSIIDNLLGGKGQIGEDTSGRVKVFGASKPQDWAEDVSMVDHLKERSISFTLNGSTKSVGFGFLGDYEAKARFKELDEDTSLTEGEKSKKKTEYIADRLQKEVDKAFGKDKISIGVDEVLGDGGQVSGGKLNIQAVKKLDGSGNDMNNFTLTVNSSAGRALGLGKNGIGNTLNTSWTLGDLFGEENEMFKQTDKDGNVNYNGEQELIINGKSLGKFNKDTTIEHILTSINSNADAGVTVNFSKSTNEFVFTTREMGANQKIEMGDGLAQKLFSPEPEKLYTGDMNLWEAWGISYTNDDSLNFSFDTHHILMPNCGLSADTTLQDIVDLYNNSNEGANGKTASINPYSGEIEIVDRDGNKLDFELLTYMKGYAYEEDKEDDFPPIKIETTKKPLAVYTPGQDAVFTANINGTEKTMTRSSNVIDLDGLSVTLKGTFEQEAGENEPITFTSTTDSDTIVDAIKSFVNDYNEMAKEIHSAYSTLPYKKSSGGFANYEPLVGDEADEYSESELKKYEEKAKQGILFGDSDLRSLYQSLTGYIQGSGVDGAILRSIGIETAYEDGMTTISLNETKLREALEANPDRVRDAFTKTTENGASTNGLMQNLKTTIDRYASTSIATPGSLVQKAGTPLSSYSLQNNFLQTQIDNLDTQIEKWKDKMSDRIDYYTNQFTRLEQLINQMNSQSSALAGLMGG